MCRKERGEALNPAALNNLYKKLIVDYFGPELVVDDEVQYEWARIPHFYRPLDVYKRQVFQRDPLFRGALRLNLLTEQIDIVKPLGWERTSTTLTDMDMNYLLLYLEENYGLISEKKVQSAIKIVANENRYHPVRDYLNNLQWDGTERIRYALHHFLGADTDEYTYEA